MRQIPRGQNCKNGAQKRSFGPMAALALAIGALAGGCSSSSIQTPLPSLSPSASTSMSVSEKQKAVDELNRLRTTHEQDAARSIEESR